MLQYIIVGLIVGLAVFYLVRTFIRKTRNGGCSCGESGDSCCTKDNECKCEGCTLKSNCLKPKADS